MYKISKGVQKPIMFKGFKGQYIYIAGAIILGVLIEILIFSNLFGFIIAVLIGLVLGFLGIGYVVKSQSKGLYKKTNEKGIFVVKNNLTKFR